MRQNKIIISTCVDKLLYKKAKAISKTFGISLSEYIRRLLLDDLEKRGAFSNVLLKEKEA